MVMEQPDKIFGVPCTTSTLPSFSGLAATQLSSNPFSAVTTTTAVVFGQSPAFTANANAATSSSSLPFARFNFTAPSFTAQSSAFSFISAGDPSYQSIAKSHDSDVKLLFGKPMHDAPKIEQSEQEVKPAQTSQLEPRRRWNAKPGKYSSEIYAEVRGRFLCLRHNVAGWVWLITASTTSEDTGLASVSLNLKHQ